MCFPVKCLERSIDGFLCPHLLEGLISGPEAGKSLGSLKLESPA